MHELAFLVSGTVFGLSGGLSPGPLQALVISQTLQHGVKEGIKIALAPLLTDTPIVLASLFLVSSLSGLQPALGAVSLLGGCYLAWLGLGNLAFRGAGTKKDQPAPRSVRKGFITNLLNPNPYVFWITIGAPTVIEASQRSATAVACFILFLYLMLVGSKVLTAILVGKSRRFLQSRNYVYTVRGLGVLLLVYAALFLKDGWTRFF